MYMYIYAKFVQAVGTGPIKIKYNIHLQAFCNMETSAGDHSIPDVQFLHDSF